MTQTQKRPLYKVILFSLPVLFILHIISVIFLFKESYVFILIVYFLFLLFYFFLRQLINKKINMVKFKKEDLLEEINVRYELINKENSLAIALDKKNSRYLLLKQALDKFNQSLTLEEVGEMVAEEVFRLFGSSNNILIYLVNPENNRLEISFSRRTRPEVIIKEKKADIFDEWTLRHNRALLVEDIDSDFRFDSELVKKTISRNIGSVMVAPLRTAHRFIGILRVESDEIERFSPEDLRFLSALSNLVSISLENSILYERTKELAIKDGLTGLYLRRFFDERGNEEIDYALEHNYDLSILMIDIDHFKKYNDNFGHRSGDIVIMYIAELLKGVFNDPKYMVSRFGGEEFSVLLPNTKKKEALALAENIRKGIQEGVIYLRRTPVKITVSIGVATCPADGNSWLDLIKNSDAAMYKAKQKGRNKVCSL